MSSSVASDENLARPPRSTPASYQPSSNLQRLSVSSLLSDPPAHEGRDDTCGVERQPRGFPRTDASDNYTIYGYDTGQPDLDVPKNDDANAIKVFSPPMTYTGRLAGEAIFPSQSHASSTRDMAFEKGGYYERPVPVKISHDFEPLPPKLLENHMNLLYFHHFTNHTARILVPHDCDQNPFRKILPKSTYGLN
jgi:hypothetical protein